ncbi:MAG: stage III sporulation protein AE [Oscillospiraceae bacterium]|nr:stage III sporulation protein AE [Oscillospiraceae bacterium]
MRKLIVLILLAVIFAVPVSAQEYTAPEAPDEALGLMPVERTTFGQDLWTVVKGAVGKLQPELAAAVKICVALVAITMAVSLVSSMPGKSAKVVELVGVITAASLLLQQTGSMIRTGAETVTQLSEYGKLLLPVMTAALAAQGGITTSGTLYVSTTVFDALLTAGISAILIPLVYCFLALSVASCATGQDILKKLCDFAKWLSTWLLKTALYIFTGFIGVTGVVSGTADATALKATKLTMSGMIPVVGGILSEASEAVLVGVGVMKSTAGTYGLLAVIAIWIAPFLQIGIRYLLLKLTAAVCGVFGIKQISALISAFSDAMGLLLGMTSAICIILLISLTCFLKGVG